MKVCNIVTCPVAAGEIAIRQTHLARDYGPCDYDIRHNLNAQYVYQLPLKFKNRSLAYALNGWQVSGTVFWHSGIPFSVLSTPYPANGNGVVNGSGPQFASVISGVPLYEHKPIPGVTQPGTVQWLNPNARMHSPPPWIQAQVRAMAATVRRLVNSATSAATRSAVPILPGAIFI